TGCWSILSAFNTTHYALTRSATNHQLPNPKEPKLQRSTAARQEPEICNLQPFQGESLNARSWTCEPQSTEPTEKRLYSVLFVPLWFIMKGFVYEQTI